MTEDTLKELSLDQLHDLMVLTISEYAILIKDISNSDITAVKKAEIHLIQKAMHERERKLNPTH